eukprot:7435916-Pyramimonas_sp.AAC.1
MGRATARSVSGPGARGRGGQRGGRMGSEEREFRRYERSIATKSPRRITRDIRPRQWAREAGQHRGRLE